MAYAESYAKTSKKWGPAVWKGREMWKKVVPRDYRGGAAVHLINPSITPPGVTTASMAAHIHELGPGEHTNPHRHMNEAIIYIVSGRGHSVIDGTKYEWEEGDLLCVPPMAEHAHYNADSGKPARYLAVTNNPLMESLRIERKVESKLGEI